MFAAPSRVLHRRVSATAAAAVLLLAGGALTSCGFDEPTDRINTIGAGANERGASVDVLGVRVLSTAEGEGRLIGTLVNNEADDATLTAVSGEVATAEFEPIEIPAGDRVTLSDPSTTLIPLSGDFAAGQVIDLEFAFDTTGDPATESVTLGVPVVKDCFQYTQVPEPEATASETSETPAAEEDTDVVAEGTESPAAEPEERESEPLEEDVNPAYLCEHPTVGHEPEEEED